MSDPKLPCMILSGGRSRRFEGGNKELALLQGKPLLAHVIDRLAPQCAELAINASEDQIYSRFDLPIVEDILEGQQGPLAGIHAAMVWAKDLGYDRVLTCGNDTPFIPVDWVQLLARIDKSKIAISRSRDRSHFIHAVWPTALADQVEKDVNSGLLEVGKWLKTHDIIEVVVAESNDLDPFFNINTRDDLRRAEQIMEEAIRR